MRISDHLHASLFNKSMHKPCLLYREMSSTIIFLVALPIFLLILLKKHKSKKKNYHLPPGPKGLPLIGNLHQLDKSNMPHWLWQLSKQYGPLMSLRLGFKPTLVVSSAKMAKEVLKTHDLEFCSRPSLRAEQTFAYNGLNFAFAPYNAYWREMRKICVVHLFSSARVQTYRHIREYEVSLMVRKISKLAEDSKVVDLNEAMMFLTSNVICRIALGKRCDDVEGVQSSRFQNLIHETQALLVSPCPSDCFPYLRWLDRFTDVLPRLKKNLAVFDNFYDELIKERLDPKRMKSELEDILDFLLQLWKDRSLQVDLTLNHIKAVLSDVFVAGTETSATTVVWAMTFLMKNPRTMKIAQEEIRTLGGNNKDFVEEDDVRRLTYLKAVVKETLRLQAPVPLIVRETTQECHINGYEIPAKTSVYVNGWAIGRDPEAWENAEDFYPERFIDNCIDFKGQDFELIPFGAGRRSCPGLSLGIAIVELSLANLLYKFDWGMPVGMNKEDIDTQVLPGIVMNKKNPLLLLATHYR